MKIQRIITFVAFILYGLMLIYFLFASARIREIFQEVWAKGYLLWWVSSFVLLLAMTLASLRFWFYLKNKDKKNKIRLAWLMSIFLFLSPIIVLYTIGIFANMMIYSVSSSLR